MSEPLVFETPQLSRLWFPPLPLDDLLQSWAALRKVMIRKLPDAFTRDEWAYLISFLDPHMLALPFEQSFGQRVEQPSTDKARRLLRARGQVAVWLPNNVSLLGPLCLVLLSLTGNDIVAKGGSRGDDLTGPFLEFVEEHASGALSQWVKSHIEYRRFDRSSPHNEAYASSSQMRVVFGSDEAALAVERLPHPVDSTGVLFGSKRSEVWMELDAATDARLQMLLKVFAIYGQAGCTSPSRIVVFGAQEPQLLELQQRLCELWKGLFPTPQMHVASGNIMAEQWARAKGWKPRLTAQHGAVIAVGHVGLEAIEGAMFLPIVSGTPEAIAEALPDHIQTIGHVLQEPDHPTWLARIAPTPIKRFVPIEQMHHFGHIWDGWAFWQRSFEEVELA